MDMANAQTAGLFKAGDRAGLGHFSPVSEVTTNWLPVVVLGPTYELWKVSLQKAACFRSKFGMKQTSPSWGCFWDVLRAQPCR